MPRKEDLIDLRDFRGVNRRDGAEKADIREFLTIQNWFRREKGIFEKRYGSTADLSASDVPGASRITRIHRHPANPCPKAILYHCTPTNVPLVHPDGATNLQITEISSASGTIFDAALPASLEVRFCFSYIGMGMETPYNTRSRPGYVPAVDAWDQTGHQTFVLASATNTLQVSHPTAFPTGIRAVNVFMSIGKTSDDPAERRNMVYMGTLKSNSDVLAIDGSIGPTDATPDPITADNFTAEKFISSQGELPPGQYYVSIAWVVDGGSGPQGAVLISDAKPVYLAGGYNSIRVGHWETGGVSSNGATHVYVFLGTKPKDQGPMTCVGLFRVESFAGAVGLTITKVPYNTNASTHPVFDYDTSIYGDDAFPIQTQGVVGPGGLGGGNSSAHFVQIPLIIGDPLLYRCGFIVKRDPDRPVAISEVFPSRSNAWIFFTPGSAPGENGYYHIRTAQDTDHLGAPAVVNSNVVVPNLVYFNGLSYFVNGVNFKVTDGITISEMAPTTDTTIPRGLNRIGVFKGQLVGVSDEARGAILASNALAGNNWSDGGTGSALRFALLGDPFEANVSALGIFSYTTGTEGPRSFLVSFKKNSCWSLSDIPDLDSGIRGQGDQMSGKVGCLAWDTICPSKIGLLFLGSDGDVYMIRGSGEPYPIGGRVKKLLEHLAENDSLMKLCSAVIHGDFYKLSYPKFLTSTTADAQLWADLRTQDSDPICWDGPHTGLQIGCQLVLDREGDNGNRIAGLADAATSARLDNPASSQDLGVKIVSTLEWTRRALRSEWNFKKWKGVFLEAYFSTLYNHTLLIEGFSDTEYTQMSKAVAVADVNGEGLWRSLAYYFPDDNLIGKDFRFRITHESNAPFTISAIGVPYKPERRITI
jgi:hypothetical protein